MIRIVLLTTDGDVTSTSLIIVKTLTKWLFFCILRTSSSELKKAFREAERLQEKMIKLKTHLKYIYMYIYTHRVSHEMYPPFNGGYGSDFFAVTTVTKFCAHGEIILVITKLFMCVFQ